MVGLDKKKELHIVPLWEVDTALKGASRMDTDKNCGWERPEQVLGVAGWKMIQVNLPGMVDV
jgi:hypothetical protein